MRILLDVNIIVDIFTGRPPFGADAQAIWSWFGPPPVFPSVTANTVTTVLYLLEKSLGTGKATQAVKDLLAGAEVLPIDRAILQTALAGAWPDFEDAVQDAAAEAAGILVIVTRDAKGFANSTRQILDATTLLGQLKATHP